MWFLLVPLFALALIAMLRPDPAQSKTHKTGAPIGGRDSVADDAEDSTESSTPPREDLGRWTLWLVWSAAMVLGGVLWWAIGGTGGFTGATYGPAHFLQQGCDSGDSDVLYLFASLALIGAGTWLMVKAVRRGNWFSDVGWWAGLLMILDGLLMFWYSMLMASTRGCD